MKSIENNRVNSIKLKVKMKFEIIRNEKYF